MKLYTLTDLLMGCDIPENDGVIFTRRHQRVAIRTEGNA
jgi:hypothetical protein